MSYSVEGGPKQRQFGAVQCLRCSYNNVSLVRYSVEGGPKTAAVWCGTAFKVVL